MTLPSWGSSSLISTPDLPDRWNLKGEAPLGDAFGSQVDRLGSLAGELLECRLGIEEVHVRWTTGHEQKDDVLGRRFGPDGRFAVTARFFGGQQASDDNGHTGGTGSWRASVGEWVGAG